ncbi:hypothetical protein GCM10010967_50830 [Dyadobacter beijingensis]|uniref:Type VI secretion, VasB, ImpH, VC_A0111 n=1 Tax=Dyadobacter beijingensis TaxID=365489 RepID=A0ABQ2IES5_9BACT|nr:type VI secretion system baseplate subunit TssG [Dyadobacter beijingensis]GGN08892.1 hypothetical protein GCM10010967_50830 [Dyadobacter beijingensis]
MEPRPDLKAEFIASTWLACGIPVAQILLRPLGDFKRRGHRDVEATRELELGHFKGHVIDSNRSGIYDHLPEQLFHLPSSAGINTTKKKVEEIRLQREKEQQSRLFFLPLEQEFFLNRLNLTLLEQSAWELAVDSLLLGELKTFWQAPVSVDEKVFVKLLPHLPLMSVHCGDLDKAEEIMAAALQMPVRIGEVFGLKHHCEAVTGMGDSRLGTDTSLGGELDTGLPQIRVQIEVGTPRQLNDCLQSKSFETMVNWLLGWFIPVEYDFEVSLDLAPAASVFTIQAADADAVPLGYATLAAS